MAALLKVKTGWQLRFDRKRRSINLGPVSRREASIARAHLDHLLEVRDKRIPVQPNTREWLDKIDADLHKRIADKGLAEHRFTATTRTVAGLCRHFREWKESKGAAPTSLVKYEQAFRILKHYFGGGCELANIPPAKMHDLLDWIKPKGEWNNGKFGRPLADTTASRTRQTVKAIMQRAVDNRWVSRDDFADMFSRMPRQVRSNPARRHYVDAEVVQRVIDDGALNNEQRLIFALARWGGLRIPSELLQITWDDVDREADKIRIRSPKQKRHAGRHERWIPIWPEILPYLDIAWGQAQPGQVHVIRQYRSSSTSAHSGMFRRACVRCGLTESVDEKPWPKLWINMRSTRDTELLQRPEFTTSVVDYWMNHDRKISKAHYQQGEKFEWRT